MISSRFRAQLLHPPGAPTVAAAVGRVLAVQAQDARGFRLAVRARTSGLSARDVDAALDRREAIVTWLFRGTLHLALAADYWWLHALTAPRLRAASGRRLEKLGVDGEAARRGIGVIMGAVQSGPKTRAELRAVLESRGIPTAGQTLIHLLFAASLQDHLIRGPMLGRQHGFVDARLWLGAAPAVDRDESLARLAVRYLAGHGPASAADLAAYAGLPVTDSRLALHLAKDAVHPAGEGLYESAAPRPASDLPPPRLLGMFDPILHGWADRSFVTGEHAAVVTSNGLFRATALIDGRASATWKLSGGAVTLSPLRPMAPREVAALEPEAADVLRYLGLPPRPVHLSPGR